MHLFDLSTVYIDLLMLKCREMQFAFISTLLHSLLEPLVNRSTAW
jgi:hypothetical protein